MTLRILLSGSTGAMGRAITTLVAAADDLKISGTAHGDAFFPEAAAGDVVVDFSHPDQALRCLDFCLRRRLPLVIGTTGLSEQQAGCIAEAAATIPVCRAANFSVGIAVLKRLVGRAARELGADFDAEILELHHGRKADAPSGTALELGRTISGECRDDGKAVYSRRGETGPRPARAIGYQALRGGDVAGEHTVYFLGAGERLELAHRAGDRSIFARGALRSARWLAEQPPGLYAIEDVLGA